MTGCAFAERAVCTGGIRLARTPLNIINHNRAKSLGYGRNLHGFDVAGALLEYFKVCTGGP